MRQDLYRTPFMHHPPEQYQLSLFYRLNDLTDDQIFHTAQQFLDSFTRGAYAFFQDDLAAMVRVSIEGGKELEVKATREEMIESYIKEIEELDRKSNCFYEYLGELQNLSKILQRERFSFRRLRRLSRRKEVKEILERMHKTFDPMIEENKEKGNDAEAA